MPGTIPKDGRPKLLDLCCGAGGATKGYQRTGFWVTGLDNKLQPHYCGDDFIRANAVTWLRENMEYVRNTFEIIHASPPCQVYCEGSNKDMHTDLIEPLRPLLQESGLMYIIENVKWAPLKNPTELCGAMFGLGTYRDRWFETNFDVFQPPHPRHVAPEEMMQVVGRFGNVEAGAWAMGINWMTRDELCEAIPPAYTSYIGSFALAKFNEGRVIPKDKQWNDQNTSNANTAVGT